MTLKSTHKNTHTENKHPSQNLKYCVVYPLPFSVWGRQMTKTLQTITVAFPSPACQVSLTKQVQWNSLKCHLEGLPGNRYCLCNSVIPQINRHAHDWKNHLKHCISASKPGCSILCLLPSFPSQGFYRYWIKKKKNIPREGGSSVCMWEAYRKTGK